MQQLFGRNIKPIVVYCQVVCTYMSAKVLIKRLISDIRFWILFFFVIRMIGITNPPLEIGHNWRQSLTNMVARNFLEVDARILYPRIDMAGEKTGIIGTEFPLLNYLIYLVSSVLGYTHWYGRLINLIVSSLGTFAFFLIVRKLFQEKVAFYATIIFMSSIWFSFSRKIMPDTFSISLLLIGLWFCILFLEKGKWFHLFFLFIFTTLGLLCKIPALSLLSVTGVLLLDKKHGIIRKAYVFSAIAMAIALSFVWYFFWVPYLVDAFQYRLYFPKDLAEGIREILPLFGRFLEKFYFSALNSYVGFGCSLVGLYLFFKAESLIYKLGFILVSAVFVLFAIKTGAVFPLHNYYIIPFVPVISLLAGYAVYAVSKLRPSMATLLLVFIAVEGIANQNQDFYIKKSEKYKSGLESLSNRYIPKDKRIIINGGQSPQLIYFAHRKGWTVNESVSESVVDSISQFGASFLIIDKHKGSKVRYSYEQVYADNDFSIYVLPVY